MEFRDAMKDRPSVVIPDDHDVYHGNIWGLGGGPVPEGGSRGSDGGYEMHAEWVRMVERTQVSICRIHMTRLPFFKILEFTTLILIMGESVWR